MMSFHNIRYVGRQREKVKERERETLTETIRKVPAGFIQLPALHALSAGRKYFTTRLIDHLSLFGPLAR